MDDVRIAAHRAILDVLLLLAARAIHGNHDRLPAARADIRPFISGSSSFDLPASHQDIIYTDPRLALSCMPIVAAAVPAAKMLADHFRERA